MCSHWPESSLSYCRSCMVAYEAVAHTVEGCTVLVLGVVDCTVVSVRLRMSFVAVAEVVRKKCLVCARNDKVEVAAEVAVVEGMGCHSAAKAGVASTARVYMDCGEVRLAGCMSSAQVLTASIDHV